MFVIPHCSHTVFRENCYLAGKGGQGMIIDPGDDPETLIRRIGEKPFRVLAVLATHGHPDHIFAARPLCEHYDCPFVMSSEDGDWLEDLENMCRHFQLPYYGTPEIRTDIASHDILTLGDLDIKILHTPGHSPGSVCFLLEDTLFSGDTLFRRSVGRCDLPGGDEDTLRRSVRERLFTMPDDIVVYPGHMSETRIGEERTGNPFFRDNT